MKLTLRPVGTAHVRTLSGERRRWDVEYRVDGLPPEQEAFIATFGGKWKILRVRNGIQEEDWTGEYSTAAEACKALERRLLARGNAR
jgi:hypothetical protein